MNINWSRDFMVGIVTGFGAGQYVAGWYWAQILAGTRDFSPKRSDQLWGPLNFLINGYRGSSPGVKWPEHEGSGLPPSSGGVRNGWSCISTPPDMPSCSDHRNFTFMLTVINTYKYREVNK
jgi:hypothetical protein